MAHTRTSFEGEFRCERCGRAAGPDMINCPERAQGTCPYVLETASGGRGASLATLVLLVLALMVLVFVSRQDDVFTALVGLVIALGLGAVGFLGVVTLLANPADLLINKDTGASWYKVKFAKRTLSHAITLPTEPVDLHLLLGRPLAYPPSLSSLRPGVTSETDSQQHAIELLELTLVGLLAQGLLSVRIGRRYTSFFGRPLQLNSVQYLFEPGPKTGRVVIESALEGRIMQAVTKWHFRSLDANEVEIKLITVGWQFPPRHGIEIKRLAGHVFDGGENNPYRWLVELVRRDALANQTVVETLPGLPPQPNPAVAGMLRTENAALRVLYDEMRRTHPHFVRELRQQITIGLASRRVD
ncbi:MAG: hypothetical protein JW966_01800 [Anaerolineae bacterium]|nr:hypothetical protein [Anaerolineae bacterium]